MACVHGRSWTYFVCFSFRKTIHGRPDPWTCSQTGPSGEIGPSSLVLVLPPFWEDGRANRTNRISRRIRRCIHQESRRRARRGDPATRGCHVTRGVQTTGSSVPDMRRKWLCERADVLPLPLCFADLMRGPTCRLAARARGRFRPFPLKELRCAPLALQQRPAAQVREVEDARPVHTRT